MSAAIGKPSKSAVRKAQSNGTSKERKQVFRHSFNLSHLERVATKQGTLSENKFLLKLVPCKWALGPEIGTKRGASRGGEQWVRLEIAHCAREPAKIITWKTARTDGRTDNERARIARLPLVLRKRFPGLKRSFRFVSFRICALGGSPLLTRVPVTVGEFLAKRKK